MLINRLFADYIDKNVNQTTNDFTIPIDNFINFHRIISAITISGNGNICKQIQTYNDSVKIHTTEISNSGWRIIYFRHTY